MNKPPFDRGQLVRYKPSGQAFSGEERTVKECKYENNEWIVYFTDGPFAPNGKEEASFLEAISSPAKVGDRVSLERDGSNYLVIAIFGDTAWIQSEKSKNNFVVNLLSLAKIPDTVNIDTEFKMGDEVFYNMKGHTYTNQPKRIIGIEVRCMYLVSRIVKIRYAFDSDPEPMWVPEEYVFIRSHWDNGGKEIEVSNG